ncbi:MAG: hypothetical protein LUD19_04180 [Clostridia bacterium]|nr:hypothetical protein [Clostridia bacterium]
MGLKETGQKIKAFIKYPGKRRFIFYAALAVVSVATAVAFSFISTTVAIILYALSIVVLGLCITVSVYPAMRVLGKIKYTARIVEDYQFRTLVFSCISCVINFVYAAVALGLSGSSLYISVFVNYYILLGAMRGMLIISELRIEGHTPEEKRDAARLRMFLICGVLLVVLSVVMYTAISYLISNEVSYNYRDATIVLSVVFAIYKVIISVYNISKAKKHCDYLTRAMRNLTFADALVSMFVLASALAHAFGGRLSFINGFNSLFGAAVCLLTMVVGVNMVVTGVKGLVKIYKQRKVILSEPTESVSDNSTDT